MKIGNPGIAFALDDIKDIDDEILQRLQKECTFKIDDPMHQKLTDMLKDAAIWMKAEKLTPNSGEILKQLDALAKSTQGLLNNLIKLPVDECAASDALYTELLVRFDLDRPEQNLTSLMSELYRLQIVVNDLKHDAHNDITHWRNLVSPEPKDPRGRNSERNIDRYVQTFIDLWRANGDHPTANRPKSGSKSKDSRFIRFMYIINSLLPEEVRVKETALNKRIDILLHPQNRRSTKQIVRKLSTVSK